MGAISAFSTTGRTLKRNSSLFGAALFVTLLSYGLAVVPSAFPTEAGGFVSLGLSGVMLLVVPFLMGGLLSMAHEGLGGTTGFGTLIRGGKENYLRLFGAMVLFSVFIGVVAVVTVIGVALVGAFAVGSTATGAAGAASSGSIALVVAVGVASFAAVLLPTFFLQFYAPAIVVSDLGVVDAFRRSAGLVRRNFLSALGYTGISMLVGLVSGLGAFVLIGFGGALSGTATAAPTTPLADASVGVLAVGLVVSVAVSTVIATFASTYQVAFYDDRT